MPKETRKVNFTKATIEAFPLPPVNRTYFYDSQVRGLCLSVTAKGSRSFLVYRWMDGKPERITLGRYPDLSIEQARGKASEVNGALARGEDPRFVLSGRNKALTMGQVFGEYMERHAKLHKKTWEEDQRQFNTLVGHWAKRKVESIKRTEVQTLHAQIGQERGIYAANRLLALLHSTFNKAKTWGFMEGENPAHGIPKFRETSRDRFLHKDELPRFFQALADEPNSTLRDFFLVSPLTGARRANVLTMRWEQINFTDATWRIPDTKNHTPQTLPLTKEMLTILSERQKETKGDWVFPGRSKGHLKEPKTAWKRILKRAGLDNLRIHDLRRTMGSWQASTGASLTVIGKSLGHKNTSTTAIYARLGVEPVRGAMEVATNAMLAAGGLQEPDSEGDPDHD